jgi:hypothetical protein
VPAFFALARRRRTWSWPTHALKSNSRVGHVAVLSLMESSVADERGHGNDAAQECGCVRQRTAALYREHRDSVAGLCRLLLRDGFAAEDA